MPKRKLQDWLDSHVKFTENSESPTSYHTWAGIGAIASVMQRKVYIRWGHSVIYPNNYIILVGPSGQARKGEPIVISRGLVKKIGIPMIGEDNSQESIIRDMRNSVTSFTDADNGKIKFQCAVSAFVEELSVFTGYQNSTFLAYLTNWYDSRDEWTRRTKHQGHDEITGVCFNLVGATAPDWLPHILPREAIGGGFTSRVIFIVEEGKKQIIPNPNLYPIDRKLEDNLLYDLEIISALSGEAEFDPNALRRYEEWYVREEKKLANGAASLNDPMLSGYISRRPTHLKKIAMALCASRSNDMVLSVTDINRALSLMTLSEQKMPRVFRGIGRARYIEEVEAVLDFVRSRGSVKKSDLLRHLYRIVDDFTLGVSIEVLVGMKSIKTTLQTGKDSDTIYTYIGEEK